MKTKVLPPPDRPTSVQLLQLPPAKLAEIWASLPPDQCRFVWRFYQRHKNG